MRSYWLVPAVIAFGLGLVVVDRKAGLPAWHRLRGELVSAQARIRALEGDIQALRAEIRALEDDPFALERAIREDLELARPGEVVVRFPRSPGHAEGRPR